MQYLNYLSFLLFLLIAFACDAKSMGILPLFLLVQVFAGSVKIFGRVIPRKRVTKIGPIWTLDTLTLKKISVDTTS